MIALSLCVLEKGIYNTEFFAIADLQYVPAVFINIGSPLTMSANHDFEYFIVYSKVCVLNSP